MDEQSRKLLLDIQKMTEENHTMLRKMRRAQKNGRMVKSIYWVIMLVLTYYTYIKVRPYIAQMQEFYSAAQVQLQAVKNLSKPVQTP